MVILHLRISSILKDCVTLYGKEMLVLFTKRIRKGHIYYNADNSGVDVTDY